MSPMFCWLKFDVYWLKCTGIAFRYSTILLQLKSSVHFLIIWPAAVLPKLSCPFQGPLFNLHTVNKLEMFSTPSSRPTNLPLCMNGGYINEASEAEARTRESNRELPPTPRRHDNLHELDVDFRRCNNVKNGLVRMLVAITRNGNRLVSKNSGMVCWALIVFLADKLLKEMSASSVVIDF